MKIKSIEHYQRFRGFRNEKNTRKHNQDTANGKMSSEYFKILQLTAENTHIGMLAFLEKAEELKNKVKS